MNQDYKTLLESTEQQCRIQSRIIQNQEKQIHNLELLNEQLKTKNASLHDLCDRQQAILDSLFDLEESTGE